MPYSILPPPNGHVPAWKRLGLKLKGASDVQTDRTASNSTNSTSAAPSGTKSSHDTTSSVAKRKPSTSLALGQPAKRVRTDGAALPPKRQKSVSFASGTVEYSSPASAVRKPKPSKTAEKASTETKTKKPVKPLPKKETSVNLQPSLEYLQQWHTTRDQWKFNKNHQSRLLEHVFAEETTIPAVDINAFYEYIRPLKGFVRKRLRETAEQVKQKDMEQGAKAFSSSSKEVAERKQKEYEDVIAGFLSEKRTPEKRRFEEVQYVLRTADMEMQRRVVKRMRAELVIDELADSEESDTATATVAEAEKDTDQGQGPSDGGPSTGDGDKRVKLNDGTQRRVRRNKVRTADVNDEESSSSESESEEDEDTSSSGSDSSDDSESDEEDAMVLDPARNDAETSSSSSSSSSSGSDDDDSSGDENE